MAEPALQLERPQDVLAARLLETVAGYLPEEQVGTVRHAVEFADAAHADQFRLSGEPYVCHPIEVATILAEQMKMDTAGIVAAILHDVIEDTPVTKAQLAELFGDEVAGLVDGVTKLTQLDTKSKQEVQAESLRKMILAMAQDLRVILVKLADRLHNMRTLGPMAPARRRRFARETLEIYAPLANRLGMHRIRLELEELAMQAMHPMRYRVLKRAVKRARGNRKEVIATIESNLRQRLEEAGIEGEVRGREKHIFSIYKKMREKGLTFNQVFDVYAVRIVTTDVDACYRALGLVHRLYKPVPGRFKDYIALPKDNGYQSLHTVVVGPYGVPVEVQIRTRDMHRIAENGIAAHWLYKKEIADTAKARAYAWIKEFLEHQQGEGGSLEFLDNLKIDLFPSEVYVFTPEGDIVKLPYGATALDFAYAVHTEVGHHCVAARIDGRLMPLHTPLANGQTVEAVTQEHARPHPSWLNYVVTAKARSAIRSYLRQLKCREAVGLGRRMLEAELHKLGLNLEAIPPEALTAKLQAIGCRDLEQLCEEIGLGNRMAMLVARQLAASGDGVDVALEESGSGVPLIIQGTEGMVVSLAKCCRPIPGDPIIGFFRPGKGLVVHRSGCKNALEFQKKQVTWMPAEWDRNVEGEFPVDLRIVLLDRRGALARVAATIAEAEANIENFQITQQDSHTSTDLVTLTVRDRRHLARIIRRLRHLPVVLKIQRARS
ncbi:GTP diphosphokinase/guanosine-3',5'-bis (diphosphate) 3'-diphosphatase [Methylomarinovum caldicuralii]|uniref:guanosine-3',5'-bis(diphosphate) 3'-diphosphatase n=1 Tax=Methylomarinovum caldicuralii TaxID=438856 RepID=A0AAU9CCV4_9GAMM|nr:bifunctional (p)ppGpp synthetase/guanosine-3',5'-bis(diphosphate) 3'-pyrophosphohydrolase [Methylomarinovum caldicuralii]BCX82414.1 GTP diphosphokinase/guanosine-3',5'-bis (diphosphate) 3'-diphosphatase [Methylomarinovum caldicuralii]